MLKVLLNPKQSVSFMGIQKQVGLEVALECGVFLSSCVPDRSKCRRCRHDEGAPRLGSGSRCAGLCCRDQDRHVPAEHSARDASDAAQDTQVARLPKDASACSDGRRRRRVRDELHIRTVKYSFIYL